MTLGTFYGVGIGPGDPELITVKGKRILEQANDVFVPKARIKADSIALSIAKRYIARFASIHEIVFPMVTDKEALKAHWLDAAGSVVEVLRTGKDAVFITIGDALFYSTQIYLSRALKAVLPELRIVTVPGITAFSAAAALTGVPVGEGRHPVLVIPVSDDPAVNARALDFGGTVIFMKVGQRLGDLVHLLESKGLSERSVLVSRAGLEGERIECDLRRFENEEPDIGYLSTIIVDAKKEALE